MTLHVRFEYPICVPKNKKRKKKMMMKERPAPSLSQAAQLRCTVAFWEVTTTDDVIWGNMPLKLPKSGRE